MIDAGRPYGGDDERNGGNRAVLPYPGIEPGRISGEMRRLKELSGLSFTKLAARTHYSRSSWERFLNGKKPVPREAIEQFASALGGDAQSLLVLGRTPGGSRGPDRAPAPRGRHNPPVSVRLFAAGVALGALTAAAVVLVVHQGRTARTPRGGCRCLSGIPGVPRVPG